MTPELPAAPRGLTVVVTNYNGRGTLDVYLPQVLESFRDVPEHEVIVVDDASTDDSPDWVAAEHPEVRLVRHPVNRGFPVTAHTGFTEARYPVVFLLSSDMVPAPGCLEQMWSALRDHPDAFSVAGPQVLPDGSFLCGRFVGRWRKGSLRVRAHPEEPTEQTPGVHHTFQMAVGLYRREAYRDVGGFCELFVPFYFEEVDLSFRAWKLGYRILYVPGARLVHHVEDSSIMAAHGARARKAHHRIHQYYLTWKNVSEPSWMLGHAVWLAGRLALSWLWGDWPLYRAVAGRWRHRREFARKRRDLLSRAVRSDPEVLRESARTVAA